MNRKQRKSHIKKQKLIRQKQRQKEKWKKQIIYLIPEFLYLDICAYLNFDELLSLRHTCKKFYDLYFKTIFKRNLYSRKFNLKRDDMLYLLDGVSQFEFTFYSITESGLKNFIIEHRAKHKHTLKLNLFKFKRIISNDSILYKDIELGEIINDSGDLGFNGKSYSAMHDFKLRDFLVLNMWTNHYYRERIYSRFVSNIIGHESIRRTNVKIMPSIIALFDLMKSKTIRKLKPEPKQYTKHKKIKQRYPKLKKFPKRNNWSFRKK